jgi:lysine/ornithine N-monooxygenase
LRIDDRDRNDYFTPSSELFDDYCDDIVRRYQLQDLVQKAKVDDISFGNIDGLIGGKVFSINTTNGVFLARTVVVAIGPGSKPCIPRDTPLRLGPADESVCHCFDALGRSCVPNHVIEKIEAKQPTNVVVVGGGLTSAQISDMLIRRGVSKVWLLMRGKYKLKHFDVDLEWVSKVRNQQMAVFWSADSDEGEATTGQRPTLLCLRSTNPS